MADGATDIPLDTEVSITVSGGTINNSVPPPTIEPNPGNLTVEIDGDKLIIIHPNLKSYTKYTVTIPSETFVGQSTPVSWSFTTALVLGVGELNKMEAKLYPNPVQAGTEFTIFTGDNSNVVKVIEIFSTSGSLVTKTETSNSLIRLSAPKEQGVYLLRITSGNQSGTYRLVVY